MPTPPFLLIENYLQMTPSQKKMKCFSNSIELSFGFFQNTFGKIVCNWLSKMNKSNSTSCYADFYLGIPEILGLFFSFLNITIMNLSFYTIIWYERFGTNQNRTLINQFVTFACWIAIANNILLQIPEVIISFGFPLGQFFVGAAWFWKIQLSCIMLPMQQQYQLSSICTFLSLKIHPTNMTHFGAILSILLYLSMHFYPNWFFTFCQGNTYICITFAVKLVIQKGWKLKRIFPFISSL